MGGLGQDLALSAAQGWMDFLVFLHGLLVPNLVAISAGAAGFLLFYSLGRLMYRVQAIHEKSESQRSSTQQVCGATRTGLCYDCPGNYYKGHS